MQYDYAVIWLIYNSMVSPLLHLNTELYLRRLIYKLPPCHTFTIAPRVRSLSLWRHTDYWGLIISISMEIKRKSCICRCLKTNHTLSFFLPTHWLITQALLSQGCHAVTLRKLRKCMSKFSRGDSSQSIQDQWQQKEATWKKLELLKAYTRM